jgi:hypothetical protein
VDYINNFVAIGRVADVEHKTDAEGKRYIAFTLYIPVKTDLDGKVAENKEVLYLMVF